VNEENDAEDGDNDIADEPNTGDGQDDYDDDEAVSNIVNAAGNISSISGSSDLTTTSDSSSMATIPTECNDGLFDSTLFSGKSFLHYYGIGHDNKKVFFNIYKFNKNRHTGRLKTIVNIKVRDYILYKNSMSSKTRFLFAGILTKYTDYLKHLSDPIHKLTSRYLV